MDNIISYAAFLRDRDNFRESGTRNGSDFNIFDTPSHKFFKLLFYFWNSDLDDDIIHSGGLLAPTWEEYDDSNSQYKYMNYDSAWAYLKNNDENERAEKLEQFVTLLSNINSESPWYFNEITGLSEVLNRNISPEFKVDDERKKISIKCLPDAYDNRIETLLSLYRDITWSWANKREVIPANLRKFDMGLYIWESPVYSLNTDTVLNELSEDYSSSYKLIEFHNCEFEYNSLKTGYEALNNKEGITNEFTIEISFDDFYEHTYNSIMMRTIGDVIATDTAMIVYGDNDQGSLNTVSHKQGDEFSMYNNFDRIIDNDLELSDRLDESSKRDNYWFDYNTNPYIDVLKNKLLPEHKGPYREKGFLGNLISEVGGTLLRDLKSSATRLLLGNLYTYSISKMADQLKGVLNGQVFTALNAVDEYGGTDIMGGMHNYSLSNLAGKGQGALNKMALDRKEGRNELQPSSIGRIGNADNEPKPSAGSPYTNSIYDRANPEASIGHDIFPPIPITQQVTTLGNLNKSKTLINNI